MLKRMGVYKVEGKSLSAEDRLHTGWQSKRRKEGRCRDWCCLLVGK